MEKLINQKYYESCSCYKCEATELAMQEQLLAEQLAEQELEEMLYPYSLYNKDAEYIDVGVGSLLLRVA